MAGWIDSEVRCPFYLEGRGRQLRCEGVFPDTWNTVTFGTSEDRKGHMERLCCGRYRGCTLYDTLEKKYD